MHFGSLDTNAGARLGLLIPDPAIGLRIRNGETAATTGPTTRGEVRRASQENEEAQGGPTSQEADLREGHEVEIVDISHIAPAAWGQGSLPQLGRLQRPLEK